MSSTMGAFAVALALVPCGALDLLFSGPGYSATYRNTWPGWYNAGGYVLDAAGVMLSGNDGKREAYDTVGLVGLRFEDTAGGFLEFELLDHFRSRSLLSIVRGCMGADRKNDGSAAWQKGHCRVGTLASSFGVPRVAQDLLIGFAGSHTGPQSWVLFNLQDSSARSEFLYSFGTETRTNPGFAGRVYIYGVTHAVESRGMWRSVSRPCAIDDEGCVMSHSFPRYYGAQEHCRLEIEEALAGPLRVTDFNTERRHDFLTINGKAYSGTEGPQGVVPHGDIEWRSDHSISKRGWRLCPPLPAQAAEPAKAAPEAGEDGDGRPAFLVYAPVLPLAAICLACYCGPTCRRALRRWGSASARQNEFDQDPGCGDVADLCGEEVVVFEEASHEHRELLRRDVPGPSGEPDADAGEADAGETSEAAT